MKATEQYIAGDGRYTKDHVSECHADPWVECECGYSFWWNTNIYGSEIECQCGRTYRAIVTLVEVKL